MRSGAASFKVLREMGIFGQDVPTLREIRSPGRRSVEELVDRYPIAFRAVLNLIVDYLKERQPSVDYGTLHNRSYVLASCFWSDIEAHHPGIDTLRLPSEVASVWKLRLRTKRAKARQPSGERAQVNSERLSYLDVLAVVRLPSRSVRVGARRPWPLGCLGRTVPDFPGRFHTSQGSPSAQGAHGRPDP